MRNAKQGNDLNSHPAFVVISEQFSFLTKFSVFVCISLLVIKFCRVWTHGTNTLSKADLKSNNCIRITGKFSPCPGDLFLSLTGACFEFSYRSQLFFLLLFVCCCFLSFFVFLFLVFL